MKELKREYLPSLGASETCCHFRRRAGKSTSATHLKDRAGPSEMQKIKNNG